MGIEESFARIKTRHERFGGFHDARGTASQIPLWWIFGRIMQARSIHFAKSAIIETRSDTPRGSRTMPSEQCSREVCF